MIKLFRVSDPAGTELGWLYSVSREKAGEYASSTLKDKSGNRVQLTEVGWMDAMAVIKGINGGVERREVWWVG